ncbi:MAG: TolC family protein [Bacteroidales bacterium]|nr:TolC family protein [Bacteroidales bacterium]
MKKRLLLLSLLILYPILNTQGQVVYNLTDCIAVGLERNFSLLVARNSETIARNNYTPGNAGYLPSLSLSSRYSGTLNNVTQNMTDGTQNVSSGIFNTTTNTGVTMNLTIFNGFNVQTTYKKLNELRELGELNTQMAIENLLSRIIVGYYNYILQFQLLNTLQYAVTLSKERLRIDEDRYLLGSGSKLQVLQSRVYLNSDSARMSRQYEIVRAAQIDLNELMAVEDLSTRFTSVDSLILVNPGLVYEMLLEETLARNTSLNIASKNKIISEYDYKIIASRSYPSLNLSSGYSYNINTFSSSATRNQFTNGMNYGLSLGMNLFDGNNQRRSLMNSSIEIRNRELRYQEIEQGIKADLLTIYSAYDNYLRLISLQEQNLETATENLEIALERYRLGSLSGIDLREVQKSLLDADESLSSVQFQAKVAEISLMQISGRIMEYY